MTNSVPQADYLEAFHYLPAGKRRDCCAGCAFSRVVRYQRGTGDASLLCSANKGAVVAKFGKCDQYSPKMPPLELEVSTQPFVDTRA